MGFVRGRPELLKKYVVRLSSPEREQLQRMLRSGTHGARELSHARVLLKTDEGLTDVAVAAAVGVAVATVERLRRRCCQEGLAAALQDRAHPLRPEKRKINGNTEAHLIALSCSAVPEGYDHWTMQLLAERLVQLKYVAGSVSDETVRRVLKKTRSSPGSKRSGASRPSWL
jgi:transposase